MSASRAQRFAEFAITEAAAIMPGNGSRRGNTPKLNNSDELLTKLSALCSMMRNRLIYWCGCRSRTRDLLITNQT
ncbi:MAG: hypothetical protein ACLPSW_01710 [Roseiarcus sp.]